MAFYDDIPIEKIQGRLRDIWMPQYPLGRCKILRYVKSSVQLEVIESSREEHLGKIIYISKRTFFMSLSDEMINDRSLRLPLLNMVRNITLYNKRIYGL